MNPQAQPVSKEPESPEQVFTGWGLEGSHSGALLEFRRLMRSQKGFSLFFMQYNDPFYRDKLIPYLNRYATSPAIVRIDPNMDYPEFETLLFGACAGRDLVHVVGLTEWLAGKAHDAIFRGFNYHRELIAERVRAAVALWMTEDDLREFTLEAPDMWAWRKGVFDFSVFRREPDEVERLRIDRGTADVGERQRRIEEIESYLAEHPEETISRASLLRELGNIQLDLGRVDDALQALDAAREIYRRNRCKREHMFTVGDIARIHANKGNADTALKLLQEALEVFKQLGDKHSRAGAIGDIARIRAKKGDVETALELHQERMNIYEQLGDKRSRAVTLGDIARIHANKGDVDKALKLHQETLEVYEQLGDKRSRAIALGDIASIYADKGDVDKALKLHQEKLKVCEQLGDVEGIAHAHWSIANIDILRKDHEKAIQHLRKSYGILSKLERLDALCFVGLDYGKLLCSMGEHTRGVEILRRSEEGFRKLGREDLAAQVKEIIDKLPS